MWAAPARSCGPTTTASSAPSPPSARTGSASRWTCPPPTAPQTAGRADGRGGTARRRKAAGRRHHDEAGPAKHEQARPSRPPRPARRHDRRRPTRPVQVARPCHHPTRTKRAATRGGDRSHGAGPQPGRQPGARSGPVAPQGRPRPRAAAVRAGRASMPGRPPAGRPCRRPRTPRPPRAAAAPGPPRGNPELLAEYYAVVREDKWRTRAQARAVELERPEWSRELGERPATVKGGRAWDRAVGQTVEY